MMATMFYFFLILLTINNADFNTLSANLDFLMYAEGSEQVIHYSGRFFVDREKDNEKVCIQLEIKSGTVAEAAITFLWRFDKDIMYVIEENEQKYSTSVYDGKYSDVIKMMTSQFLTESTIEKKIELAGTGETIVVKDNTNEYGSYILMIVDPEYNSIARMVELRAQKPSVFVLACYLSNIEIDKSLEDSIFEIPEGYEEK